IYFCEGEDDAMILWQCGFKTVSSVDQGAPNATDVNFETKLACISNSMEIMEDVNHIIICKDNDPNGRKLKEEIIRRFGIEKCLVTDFPSDCKDPRDVYLKHGKEKLIEIVSNPKEIKPEGVFELKESELELFDYYDNGLAKGSSTHWPEIDECWKWKTQYVTVITGYNNEGKSTFFAQLALIKAIYDGWKFAFFTPENMPIRDFFLDLIEMYVGKTADKDYQNHRMSREEYTEAMTFINK